MSHAAAVLALALTGCVTSGQGETAPKTSLPAVRYDVIVFGCVVTAALCPAETTPSQRETLQRSLVGDAQVTHVLYLSELASYRVAGQFVPPDQLALLRPGDLPALFLVSVRQPADVTAVVSRYRAFAGVSSARACSTSPNCRLTTLRAAHVVR